MSVPNITVKGHYISGPNSEIAVCWLATCTICKNHVYRGRQKWRI